MLHPESERSGINEAVAMCSKLIRLAIRNTLGRRAQAWLQAMAEVGSNHAADTLRAGMIALFGDLFLVVKDKKKNHPPSHFTKDKKIIFEFESEIKAFFRKERGLEFKATTDQFKKSLTQVLSELDEDTKETFKKALFDYISDLSDYSEEDEKLVESLYTVIVEAFLLEIHGIFKPSTLHPQN